MQAKLTLFRFVVPQHMLLGEQQTAFPLTIRAEGLDIPSEIFVYRVGKTGDPFTGDAFSCIASVSQLYELPARQSQTLTTNQQIPFYRTSQAEFILRSQAEVDEVWRIVQEDVLALIQNFNLSFTLQGTEVVEVTQDATSDSTFIMNPPIETQLAYRPAGHATITDEGVQDVDTPNNSITGWLPASAAPSTWDRPPTGKFFYNIAADAGLQEVWPLRDPQSGNQLFRNGILLMYGVTHVFTKDTIWWLDFDPTTIPQYQRAGSVQDGNAPWPKDYVDQNNPGATPVLLYLVAFQ